MNKLKLKICGMKHNLAQVATLQPDYLGFIFYEKSPRNFETNEITDLNEIQKVGVFVNALIETISEKIDQFSLDVIQLHGEETPEYCSKLKRDTTVQVWKVFSVGEHFDFKKLKPFEEVVDAFLFDTKGKEKGGNGITFNWEVLKEYPSKTPFILSGGIGLEEIPALKEILKSGLPIMAIDVNSRFEDKPGLKNIEKIEKLQKEIKPKTSSQTPHN